MTKKEPVTVQEDNYNYRPLAEQHRDLVEDIIFFSEKQYKIPELAAYFGCTPQALRNKFSRGSFTVDEIIMLLYLGGFTVKLYNSKDEWVQSFDPGTYVHNDREMWGRYQNQKRKEHEERQAQLAKRRMRFFDGKENVTIEE